jgi:hypothetical protein
MPAWMSNFDFVMAPLLTIEPIFPLQPAVVRVIHLLTSPTVLPSVLFAPCAASNLVVFCWSQHAKLSPDPATGTAWRREAWLVVTRPVPSSRQSVHIHFIDVTLPFRCRCRTLIDYDLLLTDVSGAEVGIRHGRRTSCTTAQRCRNEAAAPANIPYGSCRKPYHPSRDAWRRATI